MREAVCHGFGVPEREAASDSRSAPSRLAGAARRRYNS